MLTYTALVRPIPGAYEIEIDGCGTTGTVELADVEKVVRTAITEHHHLGSTPFQVRILEGWSSSYRYRHEDGTLCPHNNGLNWLTKPPDDERQHTVERKMFYDYEGDWHPWTKDARVPDSYYGGEPE